jgi:hypothetical protein
MRLVLVKPIESQRKMVEISSRGRNTEFNGWKVKACLDASLLCSVRAFDPDKK